MTRPVAGRMVYRLEFASSLTVATSSPVRGLAVRPSALPTTSHCCTTVPDLVYSTMVLSRFPSGAGLALRAHAVLERGEQVAVHLGDVVRRAQRLGVPYLGSGLGVPVVQALARQDRRARCRWGRPCAASAPRRGARTRPCPTRTAATAPTAANGLTMRRAIPGLSSTCIVLDLSVQHLCAASVRSRGASVCRVVRSSRPR